MKTAEQIAQWVIDNRYPKSENNKVSDTEMYQTLIEAINQVLRQPLVSSELNCEHDWLVDRYDHFGFPESRFCDKCNTRETIYIQNK